VRLHAVEHGHRLPQRLKLMLDPAGQQAPCPRRRQDAVLSTGVLRRPDVRLDPGGDARALALERGGAGAVCSVHVAPEPVACSEPAAHGAVASLALKQEKKDDTLVEAVLRDWRTAPLDPKLRATLGFLEKLTLAQRTWDRRT